jgi:hypothetical protein
MMGGYDQRLPFPHDGNLLQRRFEPRPLRRIGHAGRRLALEVTLILEAIGVERDDARVWRLQHPVYARLNKGAAIK